MACRFISAEKARTPVSLACAWLGVSRSAAREIGGARTPSQRGFTDAWLTERIRAIHKARPWRLRRARIHADLRLAHGIRVSRERVERLMRARISGLVRRKRGQHHDPARRRRSPMTWSRPVPPVRPRNVLLDRQTSDLPRTSKAALYLAAVQDAYSRRIVGWSMADRPALRLRRRRARDGRQPPAPGAGLIHRLRPGSRSCRWPSARPLATPGSPARWAPRATATTTPSPRASSPRSRRSSRTARSSGPPAVS